MQSEYESHIKFKSTFTEINRIFTLLKDNSKTL